MTREIKFRAWSKSQKRFVDDFVIDRLGNEYQYNKCEFWGDDRQVVLTQFTGLLDKNGKEIYEGDIIKSTYNHNQEDVEIHEIIWWDALAAFYLGNKHQSLGYLNKKDDVYEIEVIGNIYENPELLK